MGEQEAREQGPWGREGYRKMGVAEENDGGKEDGAQDACSMRRGAGGKLDRRRPGAGDRHVLHLRKGATYCAADRTEVAGRGRGERGGGGGILGGQATVTSRRVCISAIVAAKLCSPGADLVSGCTCK